MTDFYGIGAAMRASIEMYRKASRGSGRTTCLIRSLQAGDRVIFATDTEARHAQRMAKDYDIELDYMVVSPFNPSAIFSQGSSQGRTIFDHGWIEAFYQNAIEEAFNTIRHLQDETSGFGPLHLESQKRAEEYKKFLDFLPSEPTISRSEKGRKS